MRDGRRRRVNIVEPFDSDGDPSAPPTARARASPTNDAYAAATSRPAASDAEARDRRRLTSSTHDMLAAAIAENSVSIKTLQHAMKEVASSEQLGQQATVALEVQREQVEEIDDHLRHMPTQLARARREMWTIMRNMARDKCFMGLTALVLAVLILIIANAALKSYGKGLGLGSRGSSTEIVVLTQQPTPRPRSGT
jgi:hypothetical protein